MGAAIAALLVFLGSATARFIAEKVFLFIAIKAALLFLFTIVLPIVLNNFIADQLQASLGYMNTLTLAAYDGTMSFSGLMGWLLDIFNIPECLSILLSAIQLHITLRFLPFSPVK